MLDNRPSGKTGHETQTSARVSFLRDAIHTQINSTICYRFGFFCKVAVMFIRCEKMYKSKHKNVVVPVNFEHFISGNIFWFYIPRNFPFLTILSFFMWSVYQPKWRFNNQQYPWDTIHEFTHNGNPNHCFIFSQKASRSRKNTEQSLHIPLISQQITFGLGKLL